MKGRIISVIVCLLLTMGLSYGKSLVLTLSNKTLVYYLLDDTKSPMMRFADGKIVMETDEYALGDIKNFYISEQDDPNSIEKLLRERKISYKSGMFILQSDTDISGTVAVYDINGMKVDAVVEKAGNIVSVCLKALSQGTYVIRVGESSFKVIKQ